MALQQINEIVRRKVYYRTDISNLAEECLKRIVGIELDSAESAQNG